MARPSLRCGQNPNMAQFDVYATTYPDAPFVVQVQSDLLNILATRVVIPLKLATDKQPLDRLHPTLDIQGQTYVLHTAETATVMASVLKTPVASLAPTHRQTILDAVDFLLHGF